MSENNLPTCKANLKIKSVFKIIALVLSFPIILFLYTLTFYVLFCLLSVDFIFLVKGLVSVFVCFLIIGVVIVLVMTILIPVMVVKMSHKESFNRARFLTIYCIYCLLAILFGMLLAHSWFNVGSWALIV